MLLAQGEAQRSPGVPDHSSIRSPPGWAGDSNFQDFYRKNVRRSVVCLCMAHSYTKLLYHILFSTKRRYPFIRPEIRKRVHDYIGGTIRGLGGISLEVGGIDEHVHALAVVPPTVAVSDFLSKLKSNTSGWMKQFSADFEW